MMEVSLLEPFLNIRNDGEPAKPTRRPSGDPEIDFYLDEDIGYKTRGELKLLKASIPSATQLQSQLERTGEGQNNHHSKPSQYHSDMMLDKPIRRPSVVVETLDNVNSVIYSNAKNSRPSVGTVSTSKKSILIRSDASQVDSTYDDVSSETNTVEKNDDSPSAVTARNITVADVAFFQSPSPRGVDSIPRCILIKREQTDDTYGSLSSAFATHFDD